MGGGGFEQAHYGESVIVDHSGRRLVSQGDIDQVLTQITRAQTGSVQRVLRATQTMVAPGTLDRIRFCDDWKDEKNRVLIDKQSPQVALGFLRETEGRANCVGDTASPICRWLSKVKETLKSFDPIATKPVSVSETISYAGLPHEKRVTATIILDPFQKLATSLSNMFERFLIKQSRDKASARLFNSIRVNERKEVLSVGAGGGLDDIYAFSHCNDATNSIWIVLYIGPSKTVQYGKDLIQKFETDLKLADFVVSDSLVVTSDEEKQMEGEAEAQTEADRVQGMESTAQFALTMLCEI